ncbi:MAG TPA: SOS response-associated peptidase [Casimicrobiaceae bacterium]|nr:SOS response-associated peptidase [Casimicrobiaceae bacterium]
MCGRFDQHAPPARYADYVEALLHEEREEPSPRYNVAPQTRAWVARAARDGRRELVPLLWGLVSYWDDDPAKAVKPINARSESAASRPMFRKLMEIHRCVVPVNGFYEWRKAPAGRIPYYIRSADGAPMLLAGLWDRWKRGDAAPVESFTILTTAANPSIAVLHDRMPAILGRGDLARWLDRSEKDVAAAQALLRPQPMEALRAYPVSRRVNSAANEGAELIEPVAGEPVA